MEYCGMDLHQTYSEICIMDEDGQVLERIRLLTREDRFRRFFVRRERMRVVMEAGGSSPWVARLIRDLGHDVVVCHPRSLRAIATSTKKSDRYDAEILADLLRMDSGALATSWVRSEGSQHLHNALRVRSTLVESRTKMVNSVRSILRALGYVVKGARTDNFPGKVRQMELPEEVFGTVEPLLAQIDHLNETIRQCEEKLREWAEEMPVVKLLREIPGVGLIVALYFVALIDDPDRFITVRNIGAFLGLRPIMRASGGRSYYGRITRQGDREMRRLLIQAAHALMRSKTPCYLQDWAKELEARKGKAKAMVALARKLAVLMVRLWQNGESFIPYPNQKAA